MKTFFLVSVIVVIGGLLIVDCAYQFSQWNDDDKSLPTDETHLLIRVAYSASEKVAKKHNVTCVRVEIFGDIVRPMFEVEDTFDLDRARRFIIEFVEEYRKILSENEDVRHFFAVKRPQYSLEKDSFPLKYISLRIMFFESKHLCCEPWITEARFDGDGENFIFYTREPNLNTLHRIFKESYIEATTYYNS